MARVKLTAGRIRDFTCPPDKGQAFLWDSDTPGLGLRATVGGLAYVFQSRVNGGAIRMTIGDVRSWNLDDARSEARRLQGLIDQGRDPRVAKAEQTAADAAKRTKGVADSAPALDAWADYTAARRSRWGDRHAADHESVARAGGAAITRGRKKGQTIQEPGILRGLLTLPLSQIDRDQVNAWAEREVPKRPARARLALSLLQTFLNWCTDQPKYRDQVVEDACARIKRDMPRAKARNDCLQREQLKPWFEAVQRIDNPTISTYLQVALLTGARREELAALRWSDLDFKWGGMTIRDKADSHGGQDGARTIPLTAYVAALLRNLQLLNNRPPNVRQLARLEEQDKKWKPSPWVFSSPRAASGRIQEPRLAHNKALELAGLPHLSIHGLRRSFGTLSEWVECPVGVVAQIQGHKPSATAEKHYRVRPLDLLRLWHQKIEVWVLTEAGIDQKEPTQGLRLAQNS